MRTIAVKVPAEIDDELAAAAQRRGTTKSALIRAALVALLDEEAPRRRSALDAAKAYVGKVAGPSDLSTNPVHMKGFGR